MDALNQTIAQFKSLFDGMSSSQRFSLLMLPLLVLGAFSFLFFKDGYSSYTALSAGKKFTTAELANAEQALIEEGLRDYKKEGLQLLAPNSQVDRYNSVLLKSGNLPTNWLEELESRYDGMGPFTSSKQRQLYRETALGKAIRKMIVAMPSVKDANVFWSNPQKAGWPRNKTRRTATVAILPNPGSSVTESLSNVVRRAVASSFSGIQPEDVVVMDQLNMKMFEPETESQKLSSQLQNEQNRVAEKFEMKIKAGLDYIDGLRVSVNVELDDTASEIERRKTLDTASPFTTVEESEKEEHVSTQPSTEPGVESNTGASLESETGNKNSSSVTNTRTENAPSITEIQSIKSPGRIISKDASVQIPQTYYDAVALVNLKERGIAEGETDDEKKAFQDEIKKEREKVETEVIGNVKSHVAKALGLLTTEIPNHVNVSTYVPVPQEEISFSPPMTDVAFDMVREWGGVAALAIFAIFAYRMLVKSMPKLDEGPEINIQAMLEPPTATLPQFETEESEEVASRTIEADDRSREELQGTVRDNPEMAASVINQWLKSAS
jgi:flagellar M-ring protein FliF